MKEGGKAGKGTPEGNVLAHLHSSVEGELHLRVVEELIKVAVQELHHWNQSREQEAGGE